MFRTGFPSCWSSSRWVLEDIDPPVPRHMRQAPPFAPPELQDPVLLETLLAQLAKKRQGTLPLARLISKIS